MKDNYIILLTFILRYLDEKKNVLKEPTYTTVFAFTVESSEEKKWGDSVFCPVCVQKIKSSHNSVWKCCTHESK